MLHTLLISILLLISSATAFAQDFFPPITNYTTADYGMDFAPENHGICQDENGVMYFGNTGNILSFDGNEWRSIKVVPGRTTRSLLRASDGTIYAGSQGDFGHLVVDSVGAYHYKSLVDSTLRKEHPFTNVWFIHEIEGTIYFQSEEQLFALQNGQLVTLPMPGEIHTSFNVNDQLVARMRDNGLMVWKNQQWTKVKGSELFEVYAVFGILSTADSNKKIVISQEIGIFEWNLSQNQLTPIETEHDEQLINYFLFGAQRVGSNRISLATKDKGLIFINNEGKELGRVDKRLGLVSNDIQNQFVDQDGNLWLTTSNGIVLINLNARLSYFGQLQGLHGGVESVLETVHLNQKHLFVGTNEGLFELKATDPSSFRVFKKISGIRHAVWDLDRFDDHLLVSTSEGLYKIDLNDLSRQCEQIHRENTNATYVDSTENLLIGFGGKGLFVLDLPSYSLNYAMQQPFTTATGIEKQMRGDTSQYWVGLHGQGVFKLSHHKGGFFVEFFNGSSYGLPQDHILVPNKLNDAIVFGSTAGILAVDETEMDNEVFTFFMPTTIGDSSIDSALFYFLEDEKNIWYCIDNNVGVYDKGKNTYTNRPFWGIKQGRVNVLYRSPDKDYLWIGAADGLVRYSINGEVPYKENFKALIRSVQTTGKKLAFGGIKGDHLQPILVAYDKSFISFKFSAPYFEDHQPIEYSFWLEGYTQEWSEWKEKNQVDFTNLPEGEYTFHVKARNVYKQEAEEAFIKFTISTPWYRTTFAYIGYLIVFILIIFLAIKLSSIRLKAQNKRLEKAVQERTKEIEEKNTRLESQKEEILHQKTEIEDSINYAQRIQKAILPVKEEMKKQLVDSFIMFWPKDVVSGDFYWFHHNGSESVIVCADCTGHGVPGAFMSMIGVDKLNVCVGEKGITQPDKILAFLNEGIKTSLRQDASEKTTRDGMDAAIITINHDKKEVYYAGAHRSLWYIEEDGTFHEVKATKVAVGGFTPIDQKYDLHTIKIKAKTQFYMSSDGYADQFGGERNKKFKVKAMKEIFTNNHQLSMREQQEILEKRMREWSAGYEQVDDICVIGVTLEGN